MHALTTRWNRLNKTTQTNGLNTGNHVRQNESTHSKNPHHDMRRILQKNLLMIEQTIVPKIKPL